MENIEIREIDKNDYIEVALLWNNELGYDYVNEKNISVVFEKMNKDDNYKTFVAVLENKVIGFVTIVKILALEYEIGYLKINGIAVNKKYQNLGIGTKLLKYVEKYSLKENLSKIILTSRIKRTEAHVFYEHYGFDKESYCFTKKLNRD